MILVDGMQIFRPAVAIVAHFNHQLLLLGKLLIVQQAIRHGSRLITEPTQPLPNSKTTDTDNIVAWQ